MLPLSLSLPHACINYSNLFFRWVYFHLYLYLCKSRLNGVVSLVPSYSCELSQRDRRVAGLLLEVLALAFFSRTRARNSIPATRAIRLNRGARERAAYHPPRPSCWFCILHYARLRNVSWSEQRLGRSQLSLSIAEHVCLNFPAKSINDKVTTQYVNATDALSTVRENVFLLPINRLTSNNVSISSLTSTTYHLDVVLLPELFPWEVSQ